MWNVRDKESLIGHFDCEDVEDYEKEVGWQCLPRVVKWKWILKRYNSGVWSSFLSSCVSLLSSSTKSNKTPL